MTVLLTLPETQAAEPAGPVFRGDRPDDRPLAQSAQAGDLAAFEQLVRELQAPLMRFLLRRLPEREDAEDVAQETFVRAYHRLAQYDPAQRFQTWLFAIGWRIARDYVRRQSRRPMPAPLAKKSTAPSDRLELQEQSRALWSIAHRVLSDEQVAALHLLYVQELSMAEIGDVLDRSPGAIKTMIHRARKRLMPELAHLAPAFSREGIS